MRGGLGAMVAAAGMLILPVGALAQSGGVKAPGIRDWVTTPVRDLDFADRPVTTPDGGVIVAGTILPAPRGKRAAVLLARLDALGRPVRSFGSGGVLGLDLPRSLGAIAALRDGGVVVAGPARVPGRDRLLLARYDTRGRPDRAFGRNGQLLLATGNGEPQPEALLTLPSGALVVGGSRIDGPDDFDGGPLLLVLTRPDGSLDRSFGRAGVVALRAGPRLGGFVDDIAQGPGGTLLVAGTADDPTEEVGNGRMVVGRFKADGAPDRSFAADGLLVTKPLGRGAGASAVVALPDGGALVAGTVNRRAVSDADEIGPPADLLVARVDERGRFDRRFAGDGVAEIPVGDDLSLGAPDLAVLPGGDILVSGSAYDCGTEDAVIARLGPDGAPDARFGRGGVLRIPHPSGSVSLSGLLLQAGGSALAVGATLGAGFTALLVPTSALAPPSDGRPPAARVTVLPPRGDSAPLRVRVTLDEPAVVKLAGEVDVRVSGLGSIQRPFGGNVARALPAGTRTVSLPRLRRLEDGERPKAFRVTGCADDRGGERTTIVAEAGAR